MSRLTTLIFIVLLVGVTALITGCSSGGGSSNATIAISPGTATLIETKTQSFTATVTGANSSAVVWSVQESGGGSISSAGTSATYTAPGATGTFHVVASLSTDASVTATAAVTVQAGPAPVFTSTWPTSAEQDVTYTYALNATDPEGGTVSFALTSGPVPNTVISGSTLNWTPTHAQSRVSEAFTVTATTSEGGTATQAWSITPLGTIQGTWINTYVLASGATTTVPQDLSNTSINALLSNGSGGYTTTPGSGTSIGVFTIPGVPEGTYWLQYGIGMDQITTSDPNLGGYYGGRPNANLGEGDSAIAVTATGFPSAVTEACDNWWVPNLATNNFDYSCPNAEVAVNGGTLADTIYLLDLMDSSQGDQGYFIAGTSDPSYTTPISLVTAGYGFGPDAVATPLGSTTPVGGSVSPLASQATTVAVQRSAFAALRSTASPGWNSNSCSTGTFVMCGGATTDFDVQPVLYGNLYGAYTFYEEPYALQYTDYSGESTDFDLGSVSYGDFDPAEPLVYSASDSPSAWSTVESGAFQQFGSVDVDSTAPFASSSPATPVIGPVTAPAVAISGTAVSFFQSQTITSTTPIISWSAPSVGASAVSYYQLLVYELTLSTDFCPPDGCYLWEPTQVIAYFTTLGTQVTIPEGVLSSGGNYQFLLYVYDWPGSDLLNEQQPPTLNLASGMSSSGLITVASGAASRLARANGSQVREPPVSARVLRDQYRIRQRVQQNVRAMMQKQRLVKTH